MTKEEIQQARETIAELQRQITLSNRVPRICQIATTALDALETQQRAIDALVTLMERYAYDTPTELCTAIRQLRGESPT